MTERQTLLRASRRDASFYRSGGGRAARYHVLPYTEDTGSIESFVADCSTGCGIALTVCDYETLAVADVPESLRCRRRGCVERWPS